MAKNKSKKKQILNIIILLSIIVIAIYFNNPNLINNLSNETTSISYSSEDVPEYNNEPYVSINNDTPNFEENDFTRESFEIYSNLDKYGRCGVAFANLSQETMPSEDEERKSIDHIIPTGWKNRSYKILNGDYVYNRCHLIAYKLSAENDNEKNLITGTKYLNTTGMLQFEMKVIKYLKENSDKHVLYRVTPIFYGDNLVASGVQMEAMSVEDNGEGVCFNVYVYNVQPGIFINYTTGENKLENEQ